MRKLTNTVNEVALIPELIQPQNMYNLTFKSNVT